VHPQPMPLPTPGTRLRSSSSRSPPSAFPVAGPRVPVLQARS
jgi:hypothetical protein